jgi:hypothetical protein
MGDEYEIYKNKRLDKTYISRSLASSNQGIGESESRRRRWPSRNAMATLMPASWNQIASWIRQIDDVRRAA